LYEAEQDRRAESERRRRAAEALRDVLTKLNSNQPLQETLGNIAEQASQLLACNAIAFFRLDPASSRLVIQASRGLDEDYIREAAVPVGKGAAGRAIALRQPVVIPDTLATLDEARMWKDDPRWKRLAGQEAQRYRSICAAPLIVRGEPYGAIALYYQTPHTPSQEEIGLAVTFGDQIALAIESASLRQAEREGREEAERRRQVAEALREILAVLNSGKSLPETLDFIVTQACRVLGSDAASFLRLETPEGPFVIHSACGLDDEYLAVLRLPLGIGHTSRAVATRSPAYESDIRRYYEDRLSPAWRGESLHPAAIEGLELMLSRGFRSFLAVPLIVGGETFGAFNLYYRQARQFSAEEQRLATSVADQAALAIEAAGLRQRAGEAAVLAERGRLARELHDSVTQGLYSVTLYAEAAARLLAGGKVSEAVDHLREVGETAQEALREMRLLIFELRPLELEKNGLAGALQARLESVEMRGGMKAELHVHGEAGDLPLRLQEELYHVAREALNNILKHAQARRVDVRLRVTRAACLLEVRDDGVGFDAAEKETGGGLGLRGMRERADRLGADLSIETGLGKGTSITLRVARPHAAPGRPAPARRRQKGSRP